MAIEQAIKHEGDLKSLRSSRWTVPQRVHGHGGMTESRRSSGGPDVSGTVRSQKSPEA